MSIPAETPAAVTTSPESTNRSSGRTSSVGSSSASRSSAPHHVVAGRSRSRPAAAKTRAPGAHARHERPAVTEPAQPVEGHRVGEVASRADAARVHEHVERRRALPRVVGQHPHPLRARDRLRRSRNREHLDAVVGPLRRPGGEHLPRACEVELLGPVEQAQPRCASCVDPTAPFQPAPRQLRPAKGTPSGICPAEGGDQAAGIRSCGFLLREQTYEARAEATSSKRSRIPSTSAPRSSRRGSSASESSPKTRSKSGVAR